jgi:tetratricopeptide (TPR) repeat protein
VTEALVEHGECENNWQLGARIESHLAAQVERGRAWDAVLLAGVHGRLALRRDAVGTARHALALGREQAARLRTPEAGDPILGALEAAIADHGSRAEPELPETAELFLESLRANEEGDPERDLDSLEAARRRWPDDLDVAGTLTSAHGALGRMGAAVAVMREYAEGHPDDVEGWLAYASILLHVGEADTAEEAAARLEGISESDGAWVRARVALRRGDHAEAARQAERVVTLDPEAWNARRLWALTAEQLGDFETALAQYDAVIAGVPDEEADEDHWARLVPATIIGAWRQVRESAARLEMELGGEEGPVEENWGSVRLRFDARDVRWAMRTGPVSARVVEVSTPYEVQHAGDLVVFDPAPVDEPDEDDEDGVPVLRVVHVLGEGGLVTSDYDGVHPGEERWEAFRGTLLDEGWLVGIRFVDEYTLDDDGEARPGIYGSLAAPPGMDAAAAHARLTELSAGWEHPFTWLQIAEASGDEDAAARQRADAERLHLY